MIKIIPKKGLKVINPATMKALPDDGAVFRGMDTYWTRRLNDGDITVEELKAPKKPQTEAK